MSPETREMLRHQDREFEDHRIEKVGAEGTEKSPNGFTLSAGIGCLFVRNEKGLPLPQVGEMVRYYGKGFGFPVRGVAVDDRVYYYESAQEYDTNLQIEREKKKSEDRRKWIEGLPGVRARIAEMHPLFQQRVNAFMDYDDNWGPKFGAYEMMVCEQAEYIAATLETSEEIERVQKLGYNDQRLLLPDMEEGHSGNSASMSFRLAWLFLKHPELVPREHGALCALVGCKEYGCHVHRSKEAQAQA